SRYGTDRYPHSFPTRRSSDLSRKRTLSGTLYSASAPRHHSLSSSPVTIAPSTGTTHAHTASPNTSSGTPTTATSSTAGCACSLRSEEHTSELQSRENLVCRLL